MKYSSNKFIFLLAAVFMVGLFFSLRPQISQALVCSSAANLTQSVCANVCKGTWNQGDFCDCGANPVNGCAENLSKTSCQSYSGSGAVWVPSSCSNCTDQSQSICAVPNSGGNSCSGISDPVQCVGISGCNWDQAARTCVLGTAIQGGRGCPLNQSSNPCASGLKCVPGSCVSTTQPSTSGICVVDSFTCVSPGASGLSQKNDPCLGDTDCDSSKSLLCDPNTLTCQVAGSPPAPAQSPPVVQPGSGSPPPPGATSNNPCGDPALVSVNGICVPKGITTGLAGSTTLVGLILQVLNYLLILSGLIAVVALVIGGFWYITSAGNEELAEKGRKALLNAIIGMVVIIMAYAIVNILTRTLTAPNITSTTGN